MKFGSRFASLYGLAVDGHILCIKGEYEVCFGIKGHFKVKYYALSLFLPAALYKSLGRFKVCGGMFESGIHKGLYLEAFKSGCLFNGVDAAHVAIHPLDDGAVSIVI